MSWIVAQLLYLVLLEGFKVNFPRKGIVELYAKVFYISCWNDFLATYSKIKVFSDSFKFSFLFLK